MSSNETCAPSPPCSFSSVGSKCSCLSRLRRLVQASRVNLSFSFFHEASRLSNAAWKSSKRKKKSLCHYRTGRKKIYTNPIPATGGTLDNTPSISSKLLTLRPPNFNRIMYSSFPTSGHMIDTMTYSDVIMTPDCRIYWQNLNFPKSTH